MAKIVEEMGNQDNVGVDNLASILIFKWAQLVKDLQVRENVHGPDQEQRTSMKLQVTLQRSCLKQKTELQLEHLCTSQVRKIVANFKKSKEKTFYSLYLSFQERQSYDGI